MNKADRERLEVENYVRELEKADNALEQTQLYLGAQAKMNAALHCSNEVLPSPLYAQVESARKGIRMVLKTWKRKIPKIKIDVQKEIKDNAG